MKRGCIDLIQLEAGHMNCKPHELHLVRVQSQAVRVKPSVSDEASNQPLIKPLSNHLNGRRGWTIEEGH